MPVVSEINKVRAQNRVPWEPVIHSGTQVPFFMTKYYSGGHNHETEKATR